jgi:hypothetical protein
MSHLVRFNGNDDGKPQRNRKRLRPVAALNRKYSCAGHLVPSTAAALPSKTAASAKRDVAFQRRSD